MKRCWLHIGMHKTGTTSVQAGLFKLSGIKGWKYLAMGTNPNMGALLYTMFASSPERSHWYQKRGSSSEQITAKRASLRAKLADGIRKYDKANMILSGESLTLIDPAGIADLKQFLDPFFDEIKVIGYVRSPMAFKISFFQQRLKHSSCEFDFSDFRLDYLKRFKKFDDVFGREHVILRKFDPEVFTNGCVVTDFCEQIGMPVPEFKLGRVNESLCREACGILFAYRKFGPGYGTGDDVIMENKRIVEPLIAMQGTPFKVSKSRLHKSLLAEKDDLLWMEKRLGVLLRESIVPDGTEVDGEESLLQISGAACREFAEKFSELHEMEVPSELIPSGDWVNPQEVAEFVEHCRALGRRWIEEQREIKVKTPKLRKAPKPLPKRRLFHACWRFLQKRIVRLVGRG